MCLAPGLKGMLLGLCDEVKEKCVMKESNRSSLFEELWLGMTDTPRHIGMLLVLVSGAFFQWPSVLWALPIVIVARMVSVFAPIPRWFWLFLGGLGVLTLVLNGVFFNAWPGQIHTWLSPVFWMMLFHHEQIDRQLWVEMVLLTFPLGVTMGVVMSLLKLGSQGLADELKLLAQGKPARAPKFVSAPRLEKSLARVNNVQYGEGSVLGVNRVTGEPVVLSDADANLHTLAVGTTGSGKTTAILNIIESAVMRRMPLIYVDGKGDLPLARRIERFTRQHGVPFSLFSMVGESDRYNPLASGGYTAKKDRVIELRTWSEDHYRKIAEGYLQVVFYVLEACDVALDLSQLARHMLPDELYQLVREKVTSKDVREELVTLIEPLEDMQRDIQSLLAEIQNMARSEIGHLFDCQGRNDVIDLSKPMPQGGVIYFALQPLAFPAYAQTLGKLIINDLKSLAASRLVQDNAKPLYTIFDEFSVFAGEQIVHLINQGRGAGIHAVLSTQSLSDIERAGGRALLGQVLNNTNNYLVQRQNNPADADELAHVIGTESQVTVTAQVDATQGPSGAGSARRTRLFRAHPDEIKELGMGEAIFVNKRRFKMQKIQIRQGKI